MSLKMLVRDSIMAVLLLVPAAAVLAAEVGVVGLFPGKAVLVINGGRPRTLAIGDAAVDGVKLLGVDNNLALLEVDGKRQSMGIGQHVFTSREAESITLKADARGQFFTTGTVNGTSVRFLVDTGATSVALGAADAARAGIDYRKGQPGVSGTAAGLTRAWLVRLQEVKVGAIVLHDVEASVFEHNLPIALLGMSFLKRTDMQRNGETMTLKKNF